MVYHIIEILATFVETFIGLLLTNKILGEEKIQWKKTIITVFSIVIVVWFLNQYQLFSIATTIVAVLGLAVGSHVISKTNIIDTFILSIDYLVVIYIIDFVVAAILGIIYQNNKIISILSDSVSYMRVIFLCLSKSFLFMFYYFLDWNFLYKLYLRDWKSLLVMSMGVGTAYVLVKNMLLGSDINIVFVGMFILIFIFLSLYFLIQYMFYINEKKRLLQAIEKNNLVVEHYKVLIQNYEQNRVFYHDLKNQYLIIDNFLHTEQYEKAKEYMKKLCISNYIEPVQVWTGIKLLDILFACKKNEARNCGIEMTIISNQIALRLTEQEITSLFGNAIDNAIEACKQIDDDNRWIRITIQNVREMVFIKIKNTYKQEPIIHGENVLTNKKDKNAHGLGIISMRTIIDKYGGNMDIYFGQGVFNIVFSFFN